MSGHSRVAIRTGLLILLLSIALSGCITDGTEIVFSVWTVDRTEINVDESVNFSWVVENAVECVFQSSPDDTEETSNEEIPCVGTDTRSPNVDTLFAITARKSSSSTFARSRIIEVTVNTDQPNFTDLAPTSLDLSATLSDSATATFSFDNSGVADLTYAITSDDSAVEVDSMNGTVSPGDTETITVTGTCSAVGDSITTISITTNDPTNGDGTVTVELSCTDTPEPDITEPTPNPLDRVALVDETITATISFSNAGVADLTYSTSESASWLDITAGSSGVVASGDSATIELELSCPASETSLNAPLVIDSNDPDEATKTVDVGLECQTVHPVWTQQFGNSRDDWPHGATVDVNGNIYITGVTRSDLDGTNAGEQDVFLLKYDSSGALVWVRQFGESGIDFGYGVITDASGNVFLTGWTDGNLNGETNAGDEDMFLVKYDALGNLLWTRLLGTSSLDRAYSVTIDPSGNVIMTGRTGGNLDGMTNSGSQDIVLAKYDTDGTKIWTTLFGTSSDEKAYTVVADASGNVYFTGNTSGNLGGIGNAGNNDAFVAKFDNNGNNIWTRLLGSPANEFGFGLDLDGNGGIFISGKTEGDLDGHSNAGLYDMFVAKYDTDGNKLWSDQRGTSGDEDSRAVAVGSDGHAYVTGRTPGDLDGVVNAGGFDMFLVNYDSDGNRIWTDLHGTTNHDSPYWVTADAAGGVFGAGKTGGSFEGNSNAGGEDSFLTKYGF